VGDVSGLQLLRLPADSLRLSWEPSCGAAQDYAIYEGSIGNWYDHTSVDCSDDGGDLEEVVSSSPGNRYYLVVPLNGGDEGSYGTDSLATERPIGSTTCQPGLNLSACP
jgi:hypothetical protein